MWDQMYGSSQSSAYWSKALKKCIRHLLKKLRKYLAEEDD